MKKVKMFFAVIGFSAVLISCTKDGATGPAGANGATGPAGPAGSVGPQGVSGNANVVLYTYGSQTFTHTVNYLMTNMPQSRIDSSIVLAYYSPSTAPVPLWFQVPRPFSSNIQEFSINNYWFQSATVPTSVYTMVVATYNPDGSPHLVSKTFTKFRIFVVAPSAILPGGRQTKPAIDLNDYDAVCEYLGVAKN
jgi:hypothetical protein